MFSRENDKDKGVPSHVLRLYYTIFFYMFQDIRCKRNSVKPHVSYVWLSLSAHGKFQTPDVKSISLPCLYYHRVCGSDFYTELQTAISLDICTNVKTAGHDGQLFLFDIISCQGNTCQSLYPPRSSMQKPTTTPLAKLA